MYEARTIKVVWVKNKLHLHPHKTECSERYLKQLLGRYPFHHRACCTWTLPWCRFYRCRFGRMRRWWRCSLRGRCRLRGGRCSCRLIIGRLRRRRRGRRCTRVLSSCTGYQCRIQDLQKWVFKDCSTQRAEFVCDRDALVQLIWKYRLPTPAEVAAVLSQSPSRCRLNASCSLSSFIKIKFKLLANVICLHF